MKKRIYILMMVLLLITQCAVCSAEEFTFFNGLHWGMSAEEVLQTEGKTEFLYVTPMNEHITVGKLEITFEPFGVAVAQYLFADGQLEMMNIVHYDAKATGENVEYLKDVLSRLYGSPEENAPILHQLATVFQAQQLKMDKWLTSRYFWGLSNGTAIQLYDHGFNFALYFANAPFDLDAFFAAPSPEPFVLTGL